MSSGKLKLARAGYFLLAVAAAFFIIAMLYLAPKSNDPAELMRIAGQASGVAAGIGIVLVAVDFIKRRKA